MMISGLRSCLGAELGCRPRQSELVEERRRGCRGLVGGQRVFGQGRSKVVKKLKNKKIKKQSVQILTLWCKMSKWVSECVSE